MIVNFDKCQVPMDYDKEQALLQQGVRGALGVTLRGCVPGLSIGTRGQCGWSRGVDREVLGRVSDGGTYGHRGLDLF